MMKISNISKVLFASVALWAAPASATTTIYTDESAFLAALTGTSVLEDFNDPLLNLAIASTAGSIQGNRFDDRLVRLGALTTFNFNSSVNGFGGIFNLAPNGLGQGIDFSIDGGVNFVGSIPLVGGNQFWGFITDTRFSSLQLTGGTGPGGVAETYNLDNARFGTVAAAVPEPSVWALMVLGFGAIGGAMRRRRNPANMRRALLAA